VEYLGAVVSVRANKDEDRYLKTRDSSLLDSEGNRAVARGTPRHLISLERAGWIPSQIDHSDAGVLRRYQLSPGG
jgi:hypothetical protein